MVLAWLRVSVSRLSRLPSRRVPICALHSQSDNSDTIFALSSGSSGTVSGVAVIRLSGPQSHWAASQLLAEKASLPEPRKAGVRDLFDPTTRLPLDSALVLTFQQPRSFTGEDVAELHVHGSRAVVRGVLDALSHLGREKQLRAAEPGEFTRRAYETGRLDLTAVEGLADLLAADTAKQRVQALRAAGGALEHVVTEWRNSAVKCLAHAEAALDFSDDVDGSVFDEVVPRAAALAGKIEDRLSRDGRIGELIRGGVRVVIVGPPNAGKSTLLNALARRPVAIVADKPGTTRDVLEVSLDLGGHHVTLCDTAGIRSTVDDQVEAEGIRRAREKVSEADVALVMCDGREVSAANFEGLPTQVIRIANKIDLVGDTKIPDEMLRLSLVQHSEQGLDQVVAALTNKVTECVDGSESAVITRARHRYHLERAASALQRFVSMRQPASRCAEPMDIAAEELRLAVSEIGAIIGTVHVEDVLDVVFSEFCIGK